MCNNINKPRRLVRIGDMTMMKTIIRRFSAALLCAISATCAASSASAVPAEIPVFVLADPPAERGEVAQQPIVPAMIEAIARESGLHLVVHPYPWRRAQSLAENGTGLLYGAAKTADREQRFYFTRPLDSVNQWLVSTARSPLAFQHWEDLRGKVISTMSGGRFSEAFERHRGVTFQVAQDATGMTSRLKMLRAGRVDAVMVASFLGAAQLEQKLNCLFPGKAALVVAGKPVDTEPIMLAIPRSAPLGTLFPLLDGAVERLAASGRLHGLHSPASSGTAC